VWICSRHPSRTSASTGERGVKAVNLATLLSYELASVALSNQRIRLLTLFRTKMMSVTLTVLRPVSSTTAMASFRIYVIVSIEFEET
jgi:hypothetical protein